MEADKKKKPMLRSFIRWLTGTPDLTEREIEAQEYQQWLRASFPMEAKRRADREEEVIKTEIEKLKNEHARLIREIDDMHGYIKDTKEKAKNTNRFDRLELGG